MPPSVSVRFTQHIGKAFWRLSRGGPAGAEFFRADAHESRLAGSCRKPIRLTVDVVFRL